MPKKKKKCSKLQDIKIHKKVVKCFCKPNTSSYMHAYKKVKCVTVYVGYDMRFLYGILFKNKKEIMRY